VAGFAVAATVATVALFGLQRLQEPALQQSPQLAASDDAASLVIGTPTDAAQLSYTVPAPATSAPLVSATRLTNYVVAHSEYTSPLGRRSMLSGIVAEDPTPLEDPGEDRGEVPAVSTTSSDPTAQQ
jgi:hypothetical protein